MRATKQMAVFQQPLNFMRLLALDVGQKRIGVAVTDPLGLTAQPLTVIRRQSLLHDADVIARLCRETEAQRLIVGLPLNEEGEIGTSAQKILNFVETLKKLLADMGINLPIETFDERYSTAEAQEFLIKADVSRQKRRRVIDKMAAAMILKGYLESRDENR